VRHDFSFLKLENYRFTKTLTLENYADIFLDGQWVSTLTTLGTTLGMAGIVLAMVVAGAFPISYLLARRLKTR